jgi:hypothetical protein
LKDRLLIDVTCFFTDGVVFFGTVTAIYMLFLQLARQWPNLVTEWENLELSQKHYGYPRRLHFKIKIMATIMLTGALGISKGVVTMCDWLANLRWIENVALVDN